MASNFQIRYLLLIWNETETFDETHEKISENDKKLYEHLDYMYLIIDYYQWHSSIHCMTRFYPYFPDIDLLFPTQTDDKAWNKYFLYGRFTSLVTSSMAQLN